MEREMDGKVIISRRSGHLSFVRNMIIVLFPICTLTWPVNNYISRQGKSINKRNESTNFILFRIVKNRVLTPCISVNS